MFNSDVHLKLIREQRALLQKELPWWGYKVDYDRRFPIEEEIESQDEETTTKVGDEDEGNAKVLEKDKAEAGEGEEDVICEVVKAVSEEGWNAKAGEIQVVDCGLDLELLTMEDGEKNWNRILADGKILPVILAYLPPATMLTLRNVSIEIKTKVDRILQQSCLSPQQIFTWGSVPHSTALQRNIEVIQRNYDFNENEKIVKFVKQFLSKEAYLSLANSTNPFPSRSVVIHLLPNDDSFTSSESLVILFGKNVWAAHFVVDQDYSLSEVDIKRLVLGLANLVNLKTLSIRGSVSATINENWEDLPKLEHLRCLDVSNFHQLQLQDDSFHDSMIMKLILQYGKQLEFFYCTGAFLASAEVSSQRLKDLLPNLKKLYVVGLTEVVLKKLSQVANWRLELLQLSETENKRNDWNFSDFVFVLSAFSQTLKELQLLVPLSIVPQLYPGLTPLAKLRNLRLEIRSFRSRWFWECLLPVCPNVEQLSFETIEDSDSKNVFAIKRPIAKAKAKDAFKKATSLNKITIWTPPRNIFLTRYSCI